ncbi:xanthine dehydrogenase family protein molybdopterin-binding subunit [Alloalcanivorax gelatiniphagus]|uniref:Xanthine dehydrogenase family protein molybdopterin-binding subunit n=1 Tax=Alloalcanivorax gelatiniphagus TaxID=1194167 RepID=A0ABY2XNS9_9GAMM|nr:molybdopterin cofactor-binding domain-containing protein [Alloalcanivorax gelatiniphagus]TMW14121.1 xanthine dehydrogenase family protein molybdopterin-binding subunit [Alloalcanivorax gelatiniphagus]
MVDPRRLPDHAPATPRLTRRSFLVSMCAAGAVFGFPRAGLAAMNPEAADGQPLEAAGRRFEPTIWYWIDTEGRVNVNVIRAEMGQHVGTAIARILADELGARWEDVHIEHVDSDPKWGTMVTGGSWSVWQSWPVYRRAGAAGRLALAEKAAAQWGIKADAVTVADGRVSAGGRSMGFGELVKQGLDRQFSEDELKDLPLKPHDQLTLLGQDLKALDIDTKTNGQAIYGIDAKVEGMVHAVPILPPTRYDCTITNIDDSAAKDIKGYQQTLKLDDPSGTAPGWAMVIADNHWAALKASRHIKVSYNTGDATGVGEAEIQTENRRLIDDSGSGAIMDTGDTGDVDATFKDAADTFQADYSTQTVLHFQLEPANALVFRNDDGVWEVHTGNQWQSLCLPWLQKALGVDEDKVVMRTYLLGGGFGRRLNGDYAVPAALASKALDGKPVKMIMTRADDSHFDSVRSPTLSRLRMAFDGDKKVVGMDSAVASGWPTKVMIPSFMPKGTNGEPYDPFSSDGIDHWYGVGAQRARAISNELAEHTFRPGWLRSVSPGWINFAVESFMDEAARHIGEDPVRFRLNHFKAEGRNAGQAPNSVGGAHRQAAVLKRVAALSGYGRDDLPKDSAIGIATTYGQSRSMPTWVGGAVHLSVDRDSGRVSVHKVWLVVDCGTVVDPNGARAQVEGSALWGVSMALYEGTEFKNGRVRNTNLDSYTPLRMIDTPDIEIELVESTEVPVGLGEPGTTVVAPAIANAIESAVGVRLRHLPITPAAVREALQSGAKS